MLVEGGQFVAGEAGEHRFGFGEFRFVERQHFEVLVGGAVVAAADVAVEARQFGVEAAGPSQRVLSGVPAGEPQLEEPRFEFPERALVLLGGGLHRGDARGADRPPLGSLPAQPLDLFDHLPDPGDHLLDPQQDFDLTGDLGAPGGRVGVGPHFEGLLPGHFAGGEPDGVAARRHQRRDRAGLGEQPEAARREDDFPAAERRRPEPGAAGGLVPQVPMQPVEAGLAAAGERADGVPLVVQDRQRDAAGPSLAQPVVERGAVGRVLAGAGILGLGHRRLPHPETPGLAGLEEVEVGPLHLFSPLPERGQVVEDPEAPAVGRGDQVGEALLHGQPVDRGVGQVGLQRFETRAVVEGDPHGVLRAEVEEARPGGVFADGVGVTVGGLRQVFAEPAPTRPEVGRPVDVGGRVAELVEIHGHIGGSGGAARGLDVAESPERGQAGQAVGDIGPGRSVVARDMEFPVVASGPEDAGGVRRLGDREEDGGVGRAHIVEGEAAGLTLERRVVVGQVGADRLPTLAAVRGAVHPLAAGVHPVGVVRRDVHREGPLEPVAQFRRRPPLRVVRPDAHIPRLAGALVEPFQDAFVAARPDDAGVARVGDGETRFAAADRAPLPDGDRAAGQAVGRPARRGAVLAVSHDRIRDPVVGVHMVHLGDREPGAQPGLSPVGRDAHAAVVSDDHPVGPVGGDPHVVVVAAGVVQEGGEAAVQGRRVARGQEVRFVRVVRGRDDPGVVVRPLHQRVVAAREFPSRAGVVRAPEHAVLFVERGELLVGTRFDERVEPAGVRRGHGQRDLPPGRGGEAVSREALPGVPGVAAHEDAAARAAALPAPGPHPHLPHPGEQEPRVRRADHDFGGAGVLVHEEDALPGGAAVLGAEDAALRLRAVEVAERRHPGGVRVVGVGRDPGDAPGGLEPGVGPGVAAVRGAVHPVAQRDIAADVGLAGARPDDLRVGGGDGEGADREHRLVVEDRGPADAAVPAAEDPSGGGAEVVGVRVARDAVDGGDPVPHRADVAPAQGGELLLGGGRGGRSAERERGREGEEERGEPRRSAAGTPAAGTPAAGGVSRRCRRH